MVRRLLGDLAYRSRQLEEEPAESEILLVAGGASARRPAARQQVEIAFSNLKRVFGLRGTLAKTLMLLATRIAAKIAAYTYDAFLVNRMGPPSAG